MGGGDGGVARECVKHPKVESIKMVEIDDVRDRFSFSVTCK